MPKSVAQSVDQSVAQTVLPQKMMFHARKTSVLRTIAIATSPWFVDLARTIWATLLATAFNGKVVVFIEYCLVFSILPEGCAEYWWVFSILSEIC